MHVFLIRRLLAAVPVIVVVTVFVFALLHLAPGDPAAIIAGDLATAEDVANIRAKLGLDQPLLIQFLRWVGQLMHGRTSVTRSSRPHPVSELIGQRLEPTLTLTVMTLFISVLLAVPLGVIAALARGLVDRPLRHGLRRVRLFGARIRHRLRADLALRDRARLAAGAGLHADRQRILAVARQHHPAQRDARPRLHGADRAHHPRFDAGDFEPGLHPHCACPKASPPPAY